MQNSFPNDEVDISSLSLKKIFFEPIDRKYLLILLSNFIIGAIGILIAFVLFLYTIEKVETSNRTIIFAIIISLYAIFHLMQYLGFFKRKYALRERDISFSHGLINHSTTTVPFDRIQHVEIEERFLPRILGLASIHIYTAGNSGSDLSIKGVSIDKANSIKEYISNYIQAKND